MKDYQVTITNCIVMNLLEEVEQPYSKPAIKTQAVKLLDQCGNISQQVQEKVFNAIDKYSSEELKELTNKAADRVIETYNKIQGKDIDVVNGTLDNTPAPLHKGSTDIQCVKSVKMSLKHNYRAWYPELPDLLFGHVIGVDVFNATKFLELRNADLEVFTVDDFKDRNKSLINYYADKLKINDSNELFLVDDNGDTMMHAYLAFAFVAYVDPNFSIYMHDRMHELFTNGFLVSDNYLVVSAKQRLPKKVLNQLAEKE